MAAVLGVTLPIFAVIAIGWAAVRLGLFAQSDMAVFGRFAMTVALPALLFGAVSQRAVAEVVHPAYLAGYAVTGLLSAAVTALWFARVRRQPWPRATVAAMGASCPNSGYVGYPLLLLALPAAAPVVLAQNVIVENLLLIPVALAALAAGRGGAGRGVLRVVAGIAVDVLRRPLFIGLLAGLAVSVAGISVPEPVARLAGLLGAATAPIALFVIGGTLAGMPATGDRRLAAEIVAAKLLLQPALVVPVLAACTLAGLAPLPADMRAGLILSAAMPMMGIYPLLAAEAGEQALAARALALAMIGSFATLSLLLAALS
jgi:predicted permease